VLSLANQSARQIKTGRFAHKCHPIAIEQLRGLPSTPGPAPLNVGIELVYFGLLA
jgi:hypothetical protein